MKTCADSILNLQETAKEHRSVTFLSCRVQKPKTGYFLKVTSLLINQYPVVRNPFMTIVSICQLLLACAGGTEGRQRQLGTKETVSPVSREQVEPTRLAVEQSSPPNSRSQRLRGCRTFHPRTRSHTKSQPLCWIHLEPWTGSFSFST